MAHYLMTVLMMLYSHIKRVISVVTVKQTASSEAKLLPFLYIGTPFFYIRTKRDKLCLM